MDKRRCSWKHVTLLPHSLHVYVYLRKVISQVVCSELKNKGQLSENQNFLGAINIER